MHLAALVLAAALTDSPSALAPGENFSIYAPSQTTADQILQRAETLRRELALQWCGGELPVGSGWTMIHVRVVPDRDRGRTSPEGHAASGHILWIQTDDPQSDAFDATLKHELTHCVLATHCEKLPVWIHEGCAGQYDVGVRRRMHEETVAGFVRRGSWPNLSRLLAADRISPNDRTSYGTAVSLAAFLIERGGHRRFVQFAVEGTETGWPAALRTHYDLEDTGELQRRWQQWATRRAATGRSAVLVGQASNRP